MRTTWKIALLSGALLAGMAGTATADSRVRLNISVGTPYYPAYYPAPRVVYAPPAPVYYYPPAVYYTPAPRVVYYDRPHWRHNHRHRGNRNWR